MVVCMGEYLAKSKSCNYFLYRYIHNNPQCVLCGNWWTGADLFKVDYSDGGPVILLTLVGR